ncbi:succinate dehydrogenase, cytochrome b556 subunit [Wolbachia endosymbiont of Howardula sp.]|uniref:succinate dehydrogenase, cytochrome b556 subunit n=1 Tax=Wolbachia endosymbiont of Howardula sp. TaxID=2916816 RepID=UPI00217E129F|nr:succinate dehydrogenase, cytochrome b556 subunit [Wolbachia endosymbiont of Howardula sp.]UWI83127.1 succinate dehydrogenase, cytochrome b556 subunit [Wolbachia endosymbiont of Howardula sp.]
MSDQPLSPHLQIYKIHITSLLSIMHRCTGILLFLLLISLSWCFILYVFYPKCLILTYCNMLFSNLVVRIATYFICFLCFIYHSFNGIRYLMWSIGMHLDPNDFLKSIILLGILLLFSIIPFIMIFI